MPIGAKVSLAVRVSLGVAWGGVMAVMGLWAIASVPQPLAPFGSFLQCLGVAALAAGHFVFLVIVADALCPRVLRPLAFAMELICFAVFLFSAVWAAWIFHGGS